MAWHFRKRIKLIPGVHLNFSNSGISTSIGIKGASVTIGKSGAHLNTSVPGLGIYHRQKLSGRNPQPPIYNQNQPNNPPDNIYSADVHEITSQGMQGIKEAILLAEQQRIELKTDLAEIRKLLVISGLKRKMSYLLLYGFIKKSIPENLRIDSEKQKEAIKQTSEQIENCFMKLDIEFDGETSHKYNKLMESFKKLTSCDKIWDVTSAHFQDSVAARSSASTIVNKRVVKFSFKSLPHIKSAFEALHFQNANGADLYFYPSFVVMLSSNKNFAVLGLEEIQFTQSYVRFTETGKVPKDSKVIDRTWAKVNKNGTPDKRFKANYQIPVVKYGEISLSTTTGLNEEYEFSNYEFTEEFDKAFKDYQTKITHLKRL